jgi:hypothetical protein
MKKPVAMITCLLTAGTIAFTQTNELKLPPPPPPPKVETIKSDPPVVVKIDLLQDFYDRNQSVAELSWEAKQKLIVTKKDFTVERYNIANESEKKAFIEKYGIIPPSPPPPPLIVKPKTKA